MTIKCPACDEPLTKRSSHSRYVNIYVCSDCGVREAFEGFFWEATFDQKQPTQPAGFNPYKLA